jgi:micrococcal nuclease
LILPCLGIADYPDGFYEVGRIIDGDTFELTDGTRVRLIGIDAPEIDEYCSEHARQRLISLIYGKTVRMEKDISETDQYKMLLLRYVYVGETFVNFTLVDEGYAWAVTYPPDVKYSSQLADAEKSARDNNRGCLWSELIWEDFRGYLQVGCFITMQITHVTYDDSEASE